MQAIMGMIQRITGGYVTMAPPTGLTVVGTTNTTVSLQWNAEQGAVGYQIIRNGQVLNNPIISQPSYTDTGLTPGTRYTYEVRF
jgi:hypothetical protein